MPNYRLYSPLLALMEACNLAIVRVTHPGMMSLEDVLNKSILQPPRQEVQLSMRRLMKLDPEFEVVFPPNYAGSSTTSKV